MEHLLNDTSKVKKKYLEKNLSQCHFYHKSNMDRPGVEHGPQANHCLPEPWHCVVCVCVLFILEAYFYEWKHENLGWRRLASDKIQQSSTLNVLIPSGAECAFAPQNCKN